jgi:dihydrodipicolinate synthase/N-acetylneuraminate lyase
MTTITDLAKRIIPNRRIHGITAVLMPFVGDQPDWAQWEAHLLRCARAGLDPAINMDTGFGPQLAPAQRREALARARKALGPNAALVAGALAFNDGDDLLAAYRRSVRDIMEVGATPIVFQSPLFAQPGVDIPDLYRRILEGVPRALGFELSPVFAPFGRIYDLATWERLLDIPQLVGAKHSSLDRLQELARLELIARRRPDFRMYTGNDLAIDLVMWGSDYLLGLSTFHPEAFALRDRWWAAGDPRFFALNDALQALGMVAFRDPVPAYKHSAAVFLDLTGGMRGAEPHPACPRRPAWEAEILRPIAALVEQAMGAAAPAARAGRS